MLTFNVKCEKLVVCIDFLPHFYDRILHIARPFRWFFSFFFGGWFNWNGLTSPILPLFSKCLLFHLALNVFFFSLIHSILSNQCEILCVVTNIHGDRMFGFDFVFPSSNFDARPPADIADFNWVLCYFFVDWLGKTSTTNDVNLVFFFHIFFVCLFWLVFCSRWQKPLPLPESNRANDANFCSSREFQDGEKKMYTSNLVSVTDLFSAAQTKYWIWSVDLNLRKKFHFSFWTWPNWSHKTHSKFDHHNADVISAFEEEQEKEEKKNEDKQTHHKKWWLWTVVVDEGDARIK